jgi:hypothetical protein
MRTVAGLLVSRAEPVVSLHPRDRVGQDAAVTGGAGQSGDRLLEMAREEVDAPDERLWKGGAVKPRKGLIARQRFKRLERVALRVNGGGESIDPEVSEVRPRQLLSR